MRANAMRLVFIEVLLPLLVVVGDVASECTESSTTLCAAGGNGGATSLLQVKSPLVRGAEVFNFMEGAAEETKNAEQSMAAEARKDAQTAQAMEEAHHSSQEAQAAQELETKKAAEVREALVGAMQRVQRAGEVESQEVAVEALATRRLQEAAMGARQVQALEDEGAAREAWAAQLLQKAMRELRSQNPDDEDASGPLQDVLKALGEAQKTVAAEASSKIHASQLLQTSLEGAATAVEALKRGKEAQTTKWLQDALSSLRWMEASWGERKDAEDKVTKHLEGAVKSVDSAQKLVEETSATKQTTAALMQDAVQKARYAQNMVAQEEGRAAFAQNAARARQIQNPGQRSLQEALQQYQMFAQARQPAFAPQMSLAQDQAMQSAQAGQSASYLQGLLLNVKASNDAQQAQMAQVMQQLAQATGTQFPAPGGFQPTPEEMMQMGSPLGPTQFGVAP